MGIIKNYNCINCGVNVTKENTKGKYCSIKCQSEHRWKTVTKPNIIKGIGGSTDTFKKYLIEERGESCSECGQNPIWNNKKLTLQLDHIDGNSDNNSLENLRLLCPNCHTQTDTYGSKRIGNKVKKYTKRNSYLRKYKS